MLLYTSLCAHFAHTDIHVFPSDREYNIMWRWRKFIARVWRKYCKISCQYIFYVVTVRFLLLLLLLFYMGGIYYIVIYTRYTRRRRRRRRRRNIILQQWQRSLRIPKVHVPCCCSRCMNNVVTERPWRKNTVSHLCNSNNMYTHSNNITSERLVLYYTGIVLGYKYYIVVCQRQ